MPTTRRKTSRAAIAEYWLDTAEGIERLRRNEALIDPGEPMCFACGVHATDPDEPPVWPGVWDRAFLLQRAHLVPRTLGGTDEVTNLVLLCPTCHHDAPDVADPAYMLGWIERREYCGRRNLRMIEEVMERVDVSAIVNDWTVDHALRQGTAA